MDNGVELSAIRDTHARSTRILGRLYRAWHEEDREPDRWPDHTYDDSFTAWLSEQLPHRLVWLAEVAGGIPAGFADAEVRTRRPRPGTPTTRWAYVEGLYVLPDHRGRGIGNALLSALLEDAAGRGLSAVMLHPTQRSIPLYERAGFALLPPETKYRMVKRLDGDRRPVPHPRSAITDAAAARECANGE